MPCVDTVRVADFKSVMQLRGQTLVCGCCKPEAGELLGQCSCTGGHWSLTAACMQARGADLCASATSGSGHSHGVLPGARIGIKGCALVRKQPLLAPKRLSALAAPDNYFNIFPCLPPGPGCQIVPPGP